MLVDATIKHGTTSKIIEVALRDSTTGQGKTGVAHSSVTASYVREGGTRTAITLASGTAGDAYSSGKWAEVDSTNMPGLYQLHVPNAAFASGVDAVTVQLKVTDALDAVRRFVLVAVDYGSATDFGLSRLDATVSSRNSTTPLDAAGVRTAVGLASANLDTQLSTIDTNVDSVLVDTGTTLPATLTTIDGKIDTVDTNVDSILVDTGTTLPGTLSTIDGKIDTLDTNVDAILVDTDTTIPALIATVDTNVDAILVDTGTTIPALIATVDGNVDSILVDTNTTIPALIASEISDALTVDTLIDGKTIQQTFRYIAAITAGQISGAGTGTETILGIDGATTRVVATVDASGNRTAMVYDGA